MCGILKKPISRSFLYRKIAIMKNLYLLFISLGGKAYIAQTLFIHELMGDIIHHVNKAFYCKLREKGRIVLKLINNL